MIRAAALLLLAALSAFAGTALYTALKTASAPEALLPVASDFSPFCTDTDPFRYRSDERYGRAFRRLGGDRDNDYLPVTINVNESLPGHYRSVIEDTLYLQLFLMGTVSFLTLLPQSVTSWDVEELQNKSLSTRWFEHVSTPPVWDNDNWTINYIGHPVSGGWYYTMARNDGMSIGESAAFSALMSTFFWEYGYEAVAEIPSIQDLIVTPLFGSFLGEGMYTLEGKLDRNGGSLWGSKTAGNIGYFFLNPIGTTAQGIKNLLNALHVDANVTMRVQTYPRADRGVPFRLTTPPVDSLHPQERDFGFVITFQ